MTQTRRNFLKLAGAATIGGASRLALPAMPAAAAPKADRVLSGEQSFPDGFTVPRGEVWEFDPSTTTLVKSGGNVVVEGTLRMRPAGASVKHTLRFVGVDESRFVGGGMDVKATDVGLWVMGKGRLQLVGTPKSAWVRDERPKGWASSEPVVVCPNAPGKTDPEDFKETTWGDAVVPPPVTIRGERHHTEILSLKRNVVIEGTPGGYSHCLIRSAKRQIVKFVAFRYMGVSGKPGRYPLHFHHSGHGSRDSVIVGCLVHNSRNRAFVPHASHGITMRDCVAYRVENNAFWWDKRPRIGNQRPEDNDSHDIVWNRCVAARVTEGVTNEKGILAGFTLGGGKRNKVVRCVAVGIKDDKRDAAGFEWPSQANSAPNHWTTADNIVHNNAGNGVYVWQNSSSAHVNKRFVVYHCENSSVLHGAYFNFYRWPGVTILGGEEGIHLHASTAKVAPNDVGEPGKAQAPQAWRDVYIEGADVGLAVSVARGGDGRTPVRFRNIEFVNCRKIVERVTTGSDSEPRLIDIIDPLVDGGPLTPDMVDIGGAHRDSQVRVQNRNGSAFLVRPDGTVEDIERFA